MPTKLTSSTLPAWPRLLTDDLAAAYLGISAAKLRQMPVPPVRIGRSVRWDRATLDKYIDSLGGDAHAASDEDLLARL